jgi:hypothetical protein
VGEDDGRAQAHSQETRPKRVSKPRERSNPGAGDGVKAGSG